MLKKKGRLGNTFESVELFIFFYSQEINRGFHGSLLLLTSLKVILKTWAQVLTCMHGPDEKGMGEAVSVQCCAFSQPQYPWSCRLCGSLNPNPDAVWTQQFGLWSLHAWVIQVKKVWVEQYICSAILPSACLLQPPCPWNYRLCDSQKPNPNPNPNHNSNPNGSLILVLTCQHTWMSQMRRVWGEQCCWSATLSLAHLLKFSVPGALAVWGGDI